MLSVLHTAQSFVGVDIQPNEIRLLHLSSRQKRFYVENFAVAALPPAAIMEGKIQSPEVVIKVLNTLVTEAHLHMHSAALSLPASAVMSRRIKLPAALKNGERAQMIQANLERYFPNQADRLHFDFILLEQLDEIYQEVLLIASQRSVLKTYCDVLNHAGLRVKVVDIEAYALVRAVSFALPTDMKYAVAILDVGHELTQLIVFQKGHIAFMHSWETVDDAQLEVQARHALQTCLATHRQLQIGNLVVTQKAGVKMDAVRDNFALRLHCLNPFDNMKIAPKLDVNRLQDIAPHLFTACGLAMRGRQRW